MAMTATIALTPSVAKVGQVVSATLTISNSAAAVVNVLVIDPLAYGTSATPATPGSSALNLGPALIGPNSVTAVPASGSIKITFPVVFTDPSVGTYSVGANIQNDDGSSIAPTPATIVIASAVNGYIFTVSSSSATIGATYSSGGFTYQVQSTIASGTTLVAFGPGNPPSSGTLTKVAGTGDSTITYSAVR